MEFRDKRLYLRTRISRELGRAARQKRRLRQIGEDEVRAFAKSRHLRRKVRGEARIQLPVVRHGRVDYAQSAGIRAARHDGKDGVDLAFAHVTRVKRVKADAELFPFLFHIREFSGQIGERPALETARVVRKHRAGQNRALDSAGGNEGQRDRRRALPDARNVLYGQKSFHWILSFIVRAKSLHAPTPPGSAPQGTRLWRRISRSHRPRY